MATATPGLLANQQAQAGAQPPKPTAMPPVNPVDFGQAAQTPPPTSQATSGAANPQGSAISAITPQNTLRGQQITASPTPQMQQTQGFVQNAAQGVNNASFGPIERYQAAAAPYQQQGQNLFNQATGSLGTAAGYGNQAAQSVANTGYGQFGAIQPTASAQGIAAPQFATGQLGGLQDLGYGQDTQGLRGLTNQGIQSLYSSPDRGQLAAQQFQLLQEQAAPQFAQQVRQLGQGASAFGRMGSGLVNTQLADLGTAAATSRDQQARQLAMDAAQQTMQDRLNRVSATQSGLGQLAGLDTTQNQVGNQNRLNTFNANLGRDVAMNDANYRSQAANASNALQAQGMNFDQQANNRNFAFGLNNAQNSLAFDKANLFRGLGSDALNRGSTAANLAGQAYGQGANERSFLTNFDQANNGLAFDKLNALSGLQGQQFNQNQQTTNDLRGERGYQDQLAQQAQDAAIQQWMAEQQAQQQGYNQWQGGVDTLGHLGYGVDPTGQLNAQGTNLQGQGQGSIDAFAQQMANQAATPNNQSQQWANGVIGSPSSPTLQSPGLSGPGNYAPLQGSNGQFPMSPFPPGPTPLPPRQVAPSFGDVSGGSSTKGR